MRPISLIHAKIIHLICPVPFMDKFQYCLYILLVILSTDGMKLPEITNKDIHGSMLQTYKYMGSSDKTVVYSQIRSICLLMYPD